MGNVQVPPDLMSYQEAADALGITLGSLRTAVAERRLHSVKIPGTQYKYIRRKDIAEYRQRNRTTEAPPTPAPVPAPVAQQQLSPEEMHAYAQALAAPIESLYKNMAGDAVPGMIAAVLGGIQVLRGQQPTIDPKVLAV